ncbi:hypothetical protein C8R43DRAFT_1142299 [Mycena crocata]|nr:hypothetical protein C8R43DRAFT_1142299 [Mycena crocata]
MQGQAYHSRSEADNSLFASVVTQSGLLWPWIISDRWSQFEVGSGDTACAFTSLKFIQLVLGVFLPQHRPAEVLQWIVRAESIATVLNVCHRLSREDAGRMHTVDQAFEDKRFHFQRDLIQLVSGNTDPTLPVSTQVAEIVRALEDTHLPSAAALTSGGHVRACVHIPHSPDTTPLFLIFDSARLFGRGASIVVHTSAASAGAHLTSMYPAANTTIGLEFFVGHGTAAAAPAHVHAAATVLDLRFGGMREIANSNRSSCRPLEDSPNPPLYHDADEKLAQQMQAEEWSTGSAAEYLSDAEYSWQEQVKEMELEQHPTRSFRDVRSNPKLKSAPPPTTVPTHSSSAYRYHTNSPPASTPGTHVRRLPTIGSHYTQRTAAAQLRENAQYEQLLILADLDAQGHLDRWADVGLERPLMDARVQVGVW